MESSGGVIFNIQRFSLDDGPGIRTTVFFKGCPLRCRWCQNPESPRPAPELAFFAERCRGERDCYGACPREALAPGPERVRRDRCDACGRCVEACAYGAFEVVGRRVSEGALVEELARDDSFFRASGGGVTLSGGEPTLQMGFMGGVARACREAGLSVVLQTCGAFRWEDFAPHLGSFELIHFDLKAIDPEVHRALTGADNRAILANARRLVEAAAPVVFRTPVIPGLNDAEGHLGALASFLHGLPGPPRVRLLCYHGLGEAKLARLGFPIPPLELRLAGEAGARLERARQVLEGLGVVAEG